MTAEHEKPKWRIGAVDYVNTLPLIDGLEGLRDVTLRRTVPSRLITELLSGEVDLALCSIIDYQRSPEPLKIVPAGLLGCDGSTMTVRLFSQVPISRVSRVYCDTDSHTSIALLQVLLSEAHNVKPRFIDFDARRRIAEDADETMLWPEAMLLIGDKVVTDATPAIRYPYQLDLGAEWKELTGLPFVFAAWLAREEHDLGALGAVLDRQRRHNLERIDHILTSRVRDRGWPIDLARLYLREMITYEWTDPARAAVERFFDSAYKLGVISQNRPLVFDPLD